VHTIRSLGIKVLIEGVEFDYDAELCTTLNPDFVQGFLYAVPDILPATQQNKYKNQSMQ
jgi:EAL domain-containing protein (putative c-di-GMP-specific phosphodiesterase class I)